MKAEHFELLVEEPSMEAFLSLVLPRLLQGRATFSIHSHQGKPDLLNKLDGRLRGYSKWLPQMARIVVILDRDDDDCNKLKGRLELAANAAGLITRTASAGAPWRLVNRLAVEELEAWFFGEWEGVRKAYPKVAATIPQQAAYRHPDAIAGGTWESLERVLRNAGYFAGGLRKVEAATAIGEYFDPELATSPSFATLREALVEALA